ncbi:hypothetical protein [Desulfolithobacter sp.]
MHAWPQLRHIALETIDTEDLRYNLNLPDFRDPDRELCRDIARFGLLHPPLLLEKEKGRYCLLSGRKRVLALQQTRPVPKNLYGFVLSPDREPLQIFATLLRHALIGNSLSLVEQAIFFHKLTDHVRPEKAVTLLPLLGLNPRPHVLDELLRCLVLEEPIQAALHSNLVHPRIIRQLLQLSPEERMTLVSLITELRLGGSKQQRVVTLAVDLARREGVPVGDILSRWPRPGEEANIPQLASSLLDWLHNQAHPRLMEARREFRSFCQRLELPPSVEVQHTTSFEDETTWLRFAFTTRQEAEFFWQKTGKTYLKIEED